MMQTDDFLRIVEVKGSNPFSSIYRRAKTSRIVSTSRTKVGGEFSDQEVRLLC